MNIPDEVQIFDENFQKKLVSRKSLEAICTASTGQKLDANVAKWLSLKVKEKLENLLNEAGKVARRSRDSQINVSHLQYAVRIDESLPANIFFDLVPVGRNLPRPKKQRSRGNLLRVPEPISKGRAIVSVDYPVQNTPSIAGLLKKEQLLLKPYGIFSLTKEQQNLYELITVVGVCYSETRRQHILSAMSEDPSIEVLLPSLSLFISKATVLNIINKNRHMLVYTMRMVRALIRNPHFSLYKYLHKILPAVLSCLLARELGHEKKGHWALREYSGNIMAEIVRTFELTDTSLLSRVLSVYKRGLTMKPLTTVFGAVIGLGKLGYHAVRACLVPQIAYLAGRIDPYLTTIAVTTSSKMDKKASKYIRHRLVKVCTPVIKYLHRVPGVVEEYIAVYGSLGEPLCHAVTVLRVKDMISTKKRRVEAKVAKSKELFKKPFKELSKKPSMELSKEPSKKQSKKPSKELPKKLCDESSKKLSKKASPSKEKSKPATRHKSVKRNGIRKRRKRKSNKAPHCPRNASIKRINGTIPPRVLGFSKGHKQLVTNKPIPEFENVLYPRELSPLPISDGLKVLNLLPSIRDRYAAIPVPCLADNYSD